MDVLKRYIGNDRRVVIAITTNEDTKAFIEEFCRTYMDVRKHTLLKDMGYGSVVKALRKGIALGEDTVRASIDFPTLYADAQTALATKYSKTEPKKEPVGFRV